MPTPPTIDAFTDMRFITNYALLGCSPPSTLLVEFSQEPGKDLLMLFFMPDFEDIAQAIFEPKSGRRRKPARHGRKRRRGKGIPDPSDIIGQKIRAKVNPFDALDFGPFRKAFKILNVYERFNFTTAVIEGLTDVGFETLWGVMNVDPDHCSELDRLSVHDDVAWSVGGVGPRFQGFPVNILDFNRGFNRTAHAAYCRDHEYLINISCTIRNERNDIRASGKLALQNTVTGELKLSGGFDLPPNTSTRREIYMQADAREWVAWGAYDMSGFVDIHRPEVFAFSLNGLPWNV